MIRTLISVSVLGLLASAVPDGTAKPKPQLAAGGTVLPVVASAPAPQDATSAPYLLFIQQARSATLKLDPLHPLNGTLTLKSVSPHTVWFTDAPNRKAGQLETGFFAGPSFSQENGTWLHTPNAALYGATGTPGPLPANDTVVIVTLYNPVYIPANETLVYKVTIIPADDMELTSPSVKQAFIDTSQTMGPKVVTLPPLEDMEFNNVALFIDTWWLWWPWSVNTCWGPCCWGGCYGGGGWGGGGGGWGGGGGCRNCGCNGCG